MRSFQQKLAEYPIGYAPLSTLSDPSSDDAAQGRISMHRTMLGYCPIDASGQSASSLVEVGKSK